MNNIEFLLTPILTVLVSIALGFVIPYAYGYSDFFWFSLIGFAPLYGIPILLFYEYNKSDRSILSINISKEMIIVSKTSGKYTLERKDISYIERHQPRYSSSWQRYHFFRIVTKNNEELIISCLLDESKELILASRVIERFIPFIYNRRMENESGRIINWN